MPTVVARAPGRISLAGGGTDLPAYYERHGGAVVSFAIPLTSTATLSERAPGLELVCQDQGVREVVPAERFERHMRHPFLAREFVTLHKAVAWHFGLDRVRVSTMTELPAGGGLGSSAAVCAALVAAAGAFVGDKMDPATTAAIAARIEMAVLRRPCGKQDHYAAAFGGLNLIEFLRDGTVWVTPIALLPASRRELERHLVLFSNGGRRNGAAPLAELVRRIRSEERATVRAMSEVHEVAYLVRSALERGDPKTLGALVDRGWRAKRSLHPLVTTPEIDRVYAMAREAGALGGKLAGAGLAGGMLFVCPPERQADVREVMSTQGWRASDVAIEDSGARLLEPLGGEATSANRG